MTYRNAVIEGQNDQATAVCNVHESLVKAELVVLKICSRTDRHTNTRVRACVRACVRVCVCVCARVCEYLHSCIQRFLQFRPNGWRAGW